MPFGNPLLSAEELDTSNQGEREGIWVHDGLIELYDETGSLTTTLYWSDETGSFWIAMGDQGIANPVARLTMSPQGVLTLSSDVDMRISTQDLMWFIANKDNVLDPGQQFRFSGAPVNIEGGLSVGPTGVVNTIWESITKEIIPFNPQSIAANSGGTYAIPYADAVVGQTSVVYMEGCTNGIVPYQWRVAVDGQISLNVRNVTGAAIDAPLTDFVFVVYQEAI